MSETPRDQPRTFDLLSPDTVIDAAERAYGLDLDGTMLAFSSYVNRVYGLRTQDGVRYVAKFYRPGRWSPEAILEEHRFVLDCADVGLPVVAPLEGADGTLGRVEVDGDGARETFLFSLTPLKAGRGFDAEGDEDWRRLGSLVGRVHAVGGKRSAPHRASLGPGTSTQPFARELVDADLVHPDIREALEGVVLDTLELIGPLFDGVAAQRIHGDSHRGNILDRPGEGLLLIDFDDMMMGPPIQDLWLLLPDRASRCRRELELLLEGYQTFLPLDPGTMRLIEPLRFMRMISYLAWQARQRNDGRFRSENPSWGTRAFWILEVEDLRAQLDVIRDELDVGG